MSSRAHYSQASTLIPANSNAEALDDICPYGPRVPTSCDEKMSDIVDARDHAYSHSETLSSAVHSPLSVASFTDNAVSDDLLGDHPGDGWKYNHPRSHRYYLMRIPVQVEQGSHHLITKYVKYNHHVPYLTIEATMGRGAPEFTRTLEAIPTRQNLPRLTLPQQRLLDCNAAESRTIDRTLAKVDSWPLQGELQCFHTLRARIAMLHEETLCSRGNLATTTQELQESIDRLS